MIARPPLAHVREIFPNVVCKAEEAAALIQCNAAVLSLKFRTGKIRGTRAFGKWRVLGSELLRVASK